MKYEALKTFTVKTKEGGSLTLKPGQTIILKEEKALKLIKEGKIKPLPYLENDILRIPFNSPGRFHWWNRGQSILDTLKELNANEEIIKRYKFFSN
ncbi:MAG: hypothetical protein L3J18_03295 [Candidatus Brocadia sp.]|jgi:hypothetical protein|uniref:Uncharacterized protein n=1 Tax=Candidatus Brocadia fulgida TaxID=380242 RepID=A0A0M2UXW6_9BACT|nr:MAG: hypothetical protein BROFUL_01479 [Candidatus Brocadia fulgida]UJS21345.1 MAG: hypothetical protein L3J18_03295 [Candidatus Brocadia sp.]